MRGLVLVLPMLALVACDTPPLHLAIDVSPAAMEACGGASCAAVHMSCAAVAGIRILDPNDPTAPYQSICRDVPFDNKNDLCSLAGLELDATTPLPETTLEIQVVIFPKDDLPRDADNNPICPATTQFDATNGFPYGVASFQDPLHPEEPHTARPAIGGRAYYHVGDSQTVVALGCPDLAALNDPTCEGNQTIEIVATVTDFDNGQPVSVATGNGLALSIGEPVVTSGPGSVEYVLNPADTVSLPRKDVAPIPAWGGPIDLQFTQFVCLDILENQPMTTATLSCKTASPADARIDVVGTYLNSETLGSLLAALGNPSLKKGLVIGRVLDDVGSPAAEQEITLSDINAHVQYLSVDGSHFIPGGPGVKTTASGIFVSTDAPFKTQFLTQFASGTVFAVGGLVDNKVTVVTLRSKPPVVGGQ